MISRGEQGVEATRDTRDIRDIRDIHDVPETTLSFPVFGDVQVRDLRRFRIQRPPWKSIRHTLLPFIRAWTTANDNPDWAACMVTVTLSVFVASPEYACVLLDVPWAWVALLSDGGFCGHPQSDALPWYWLVRAHESIQVPGPGPKPVDADVSVVLFFGHHESGLRGIRPEGFEGLHDSLLRQPSSSVHTPCACPWCLSVARTHALHNAAVILRHEDGAETFIPCLDLRRVNGGGGGTEPCPNQLRMLWRDPVGPCSNEHGMWANIAGYLHNVAGELNSPRGVVVDGGLGCVGREFGALLFSAHHVSDNVHWWLEDEPWCVLCVDPATHWHLLHTKGRVLAVSFNG